jgi:hypothetical protein
MTRWKSGFVVAGAALILAAGAWAAKGADKGQGAPHWQFAGENQGIRFSFKIANECRESGASLELKLENTQDFAVTVSFRIVDPDWTQTFERELGPNAKDTAIHFVPDEGTACHPYVDEVYVEPHGTQVSHSGGADNEEGAHP